MKEYKPIYFILKMNIDFLKIKRKSSIIQNEKINNNLLSNYKIYLFNI